MTDLAEPFMTGVLCGNPAHGSGQLNPANGSWRIVQVLSTNPKLNQMLIPPTAVGG